MTMPLRRMSDTYSKNYSTRRPRVDFTCGSCGSKLGVNFKCPECIASRDPERSSADAKRQAIVKNVLPINQTVYVREMLRAGHVIKHVRSRSGEVTQYRISFECGEFEDDAVEFVEKDKVCKLIRGSCGGTKWPSRAIPCRTRVAAVDGCRV
jgi:hypothetical protein